MATPKFRALLQDLLEKTNAGLVKWGETADDSSYRVKLGKALIRVSIRTDDDDVTRATAYLINPNGTFVDSMEEKLGGPLVDPLWDAARASALDADSLIDDALNTLNTGGATTPAKEVKDKDTDLPF
jgi:hypothetical protein